jgi:anti-anti-sigma factor
VFSARNQADLTKWVNDSLEKGYKLLLLDLQQVYLMDRMGLVSLLQTRDRILQADATFALCSLHGQAQMMLEMCEAASDVPIYRDRQEFEQRLDFSTFIAA